MSDMTAGDWATLLMSMAALGTAAAAIWKAQRTAPAEVKNIDADTASKYAEIARGAAEDVLKMNDKFDLLADRMEIMEHNFHTAMEYIQTLLAGIDRLIHQLKANNMTPVWTPPVMPKLKDTGELKQK